MSDNLQRAAKFIEDKYGVVIYNSNSLGTLKIRGTYTEALPWNTLVITGNLNENTLVTDNLNKSIAL